MRCLRLTCSLLYLSQRHMTLRAGQLYHSCNGGVKQWKKEDKYIEIVRYDHLITKVIFKYVCVST